MAKTKALPTSVTITLDATTKTKQPENVSDVPLSEAELVARALATSPGLTIERLARDGLLDRSRTLIRFARPEVGKAFGAADRRIAKAFEEILAENRTRARVGKRELKITSATLARRAATNTVTAQRWLTELSSTAPA